ncbi:MAG: glycerophosphodiester phosphodiesterase [Myxococcota bacterium]
MAHPYFDVPTPTVLGHRGAAGTAPENTLLSFERGLALGADIVESDVHLTRDGIPVLIHDDAVDRTTDGSGRVADFDLAALGQLDAGYRFSLDDGESFPFRGQKLRIPTLDEAFATFPRARFNLELKEDQPRLVERCLELLKAHSRESITLLTAELDPVLDRVRSQCQRTGVAPALGASVRDIVAVIRSALENRPPDTDSMALQIPTEFGGRPLVTPQLVAHAHAHGIAIHVWTINETQEIAALVGQGVDGIVTDYPGRMAGWVAERGGRH